MPKIVYGEITAAAAAVAPEGMIAKIHFPTLALMDTRTGDGRLLRSSGAGARELPQSVFHQFSQAPGHDGSVLVGSLTSITFDTDTKNVEGWGWLADTEEGRKSLFAIKSAQMRGNSVDLAEVDVLVNPNFEEDYIELNELDEETGFFHMGMIKVDFAQWKIAATTIVGTPAFAEASVEIEEEITAALEAGELITVEMPSQWTISDSYMGPQANVDLADTTTETVASVTLSDGSSTLRGMTWNPVTYNSLNSTFKEGFMDDLARTKPPGAVPAEPFRAPEPDQPTPFTVDERGHVYGHLGLYGECHTGVMDRCVMIPHSRDNYSSFLKKNVLTDAGLIPTGPIMLYGGHPKPGVLKPGNVTSVYGGIENAWADVTVTDGKFGPWICGTVRPGTDPDKIYAARASGLSGHWLNGDLYAIVSVNAEGYNVPRQFGNHDGLIELIASAEICDCNVDDASLTEAEVALLEFILADLTED